MPEHIQNVVVPEVKMDCEQKTGKFVHKCFDGWDSAQKRTSGLKRPFTRNQKRKNLE